MKLRHVTDSREAGEQHLARTGGGAQDCISTGLSQDVVTVRSSVAHEDVDVHVDKTGQQRDIAEIDNSSGRWRACRIDGLNHAAGDDQDSGRNDATASHVEHTLGAQYGGLCGSSGK